MLPLVSVVILSYKNIEGIYNSINSVLIQTYENIEIVVSDDGTPDFNLVRESIERYIADNNRGNIRNVIINEIMTNVGTVRNINSAIRLAKGKYIKALSSEDCLSKENTIQSYINYMEGNASEICFGKMRGVTKDGEYLYNLTSCDFDYDKLRSYSAKQIEEKLYGRNFLPAPAWMIRKDFFEREGYFEEKVRLIEDYPYWIMLARKDIKFDFIDEITVDYMMSGVSSGGHYSEMFMNDMMIIYDEYIFPYDHRYGVLQPIYNGLKKGGLNYYMLLAKWEKISKVKRYIGMIKYAPFFIYTGIINTINNIKNKKG